MLGGLRVGNLAINVPRHQCWHLWWMPLKTEVLEQFVVSLSHPSFAMVGCYVVAGDPSPAIV